VGFLTVLGFVLGYAIDLAPTNGSNNPAPAKSAEEKTEVMHNNLANIITGAKPNQHDGYQARAFPNRRLEVAFRVNNCFTAMQKKRCDDVRQAVLTLLQPAKPGVTGRWQDWPELVEAARTVTRAELSLSRDEVKLNLFAAMQIVTMKTMLKVLFDKSPTDTDKDLQIRKLAKDVDRQWQESKGRLVLGEAPDWDFEQQGTLKATAEDILGPWDAEQERNPFNMILPGYETMWRVVMRCFLELASSRHSSAAKEAWKERLALFIANSTKKQLQEAANDDGLTAEHVSFEILRLYPPTRHVAREHKDPDTGAVRSLTADIENMHHTAPIWGDDALSFRPERWIVLTKGVNTPGFMPFGEKPFRCPARQTQDEYWPFGVMMIAVLTGCFIEAMAGKWRLDGQHIPDADQPMGNNRDDYKRVSLLRLKPAADELASNAAAQPGKLAVEETATNETVTYETTTSETAANETATSETTANETTANGTTADEIGSGNTDAGKADADITGADNDGSNKAGEDANTSDETQTDADQTSDEVERGSGEANGPGEEDLEQIIASYR
jgi:hypothetical protein